MTRTADRTDQWTDEWTDEWTVETLDLDAYLDRVAHTGPTDVSLGTLTRLHRAHVAAVPFENLDVILGRGVSVNLDRVQAKLVHDRRGGYCYEQGLLFAAVLERLGFGVRRLLARVGGEGRRPGPRTHLTLVVGIGTDPGLSGDRWLAHVGFGSGLLTPLPLQAGRAEAQGDWEYRLERPAEGAWKLQERQGEVWTTVYSVREEHQHFSDVEMSNHFTSTWPESPFRQQPIVVRKDDHEVRSLIGRRFVRTRPGGATDERQLDDAEVGPALESLGLHLTPQETHLIVAALPAPVAP